MMEILVAFVISAIVIGGVLSVYMQQFSKGGCGCGPNGGLIPTSFSNPRPNITTNGGGWIVMVETISEPVAWKSINVSLEQNGIRRAIMSGVSTSSADLNGLNNSKTGSAGWYLKKEISVPIDQVMFSFETGGKASSVKGESSELLLDRFETVQGASFIVVDANYDGLITSGDFILVFADPNADGIKEIGGIGY
jgi:hypothetical protein